MLNFFRYSLFMFTPNIPSNPAPGSLGKYVPTWSNKFFEVHVTEIFDKFMGLTIMKCYHTWPFLIRRIGRLSTTSTSRKPRGTHLFWDSEVVMPTMLNLFLFCVFFLFVFIFFVVLIHFFTKRPFIYIREVSLAGTAVLFFILVVFCGTQYSAFFELSSFLSAGLDSWLEYRWSVQNGENYLNRWSYSGEEVLCLGTVDLLWRFAVLDYITRMVPFFNFFNDFGPLSPNFNTEQWQHITLNTYLDNGARRFWTSQVPWWRGFFWPWCHGEAPVSGSMLFTAKSKFAWGFNGFFQDFGFLKYGVYKTSFFYPLLDSTFDIVFSFDGISLIFICLTTFIISLCIIVSWYSYKFELYTLLISLLLITQLLIIISFSVLDLLFFYIAFESVLIPLFFLVGIFGSRERRIKAAYYLMFYTLFGSVPFLIGLIYIWHKTGQTNILILEALFYGVFSKHEIALLWFLFLPGFAFKIPLYPFHLWLPEAHVEAPTVGSVILAGLVLKLGGYGFIRFSLGLLYWGGVPFFGYVYWISAFSMLFAILCAACQIDLKRIIAYGSVSHMSLVTLCIFLGTQSGLESAMIMMLGHGFVSSGLFILIGSLYERYHTRNIRYYGGLYKLLPRFGTLFLLFVLFDIGVPGSPAFVAEFVALVSITQESVVLAVLCSIPIIIGAGVSLLLASRVLFGFNEKRYLVNMPVQFTNFLYWCELQMPTVLKTFVQKDPTPVYLKTASIVVPTTFDLLPHEVFVLICLFGGSFLLGVYPQLFLNIFTQDLELILQNVAFFF